VRVNPRGDVPTQLPAPTTPVPTPSTLGQKAAEMRENMLGLKVTNLEGDLDDRAIFDYAKANISTDDAFDTLADEIPHLAEAEAQVRAMGKLIAEEVEKRIPPPINEAERLRQIKKLEDDFNAAFVQRSGYEQQLRDQICIERFGTRFVNVELDLQKRTAIVRAIREDPKMKRLEKIEDDARAAMRKAQQRSVDVENILARREALKEVMSEIRPMGGELTKGSVPRSQAADAKKALDFYPTDWINASNTFERPLVISGRVIQRGHYAHTAFQKATRTRAGGSIREIKLSEDYGHRTSAVDSSTFTTLVHELGHAFQYSVGPRRARIPRVIGGVEIKTYEQKKLIALLENVFRLRRTTKNGVREPLKGMSYSAREQTRPDEYVSEYIGREYGRGDGLEGTTEVLTEGMEFIVGGRKDLWNLDPDMRDFVLGLLAVL
jgi:hypothetical protein